MEKYISLEGEINTELFDKFLKDFNRIDEDIVIYLNSRGGYISTQEAIVDLINRNKNRITIIGYCELYSSAFDIFFKSKCKKILIPNTTGMVHLGSIDIQINENGRPLSIGDKFQLRQLKSTKIESLNYYRDLGLNNTEVSKVARNMDVYLDYKRLVELLNN